MVPSDAQLYRFRRRTDFLRRAHAVLYRTYQRFLRLSCAQKVHDRQRGGRQVSQTRTGAGSKTGGGEKDRAFRKRNVGLRRIKIYLRSN